MTFLSPRGKEALKSYKYKGYDLSPLSKYVFQPFWSQFIKLLPLNVAPNLITLTGLSLIAASCVLSFLYSPDLVKETPRWLHFVHGLCLFLYQTLDAVDGKQARRTGSSSPLGELFDHGCDAIACSLEALTFASVTLQGRKVIWPWLVATSAFYIATLETFYTHTLLLNVINGPTEGLLAMYTAEFWTAIVGSQWWLQDFRVVFHLPNDSFSFLPSIPLNEFCVWACVPFLLVTMVASAINIRAATANSCSNLPAPHLLLLPFVSLVMCHVIWMYISPTNVMAAYPYMAIIAIGSAFSLLVGRLIVGHLCNDGDALVDSLWAPLAILPLAVLNATIGRFSDWPIHVDEYWLLLAHLLYSVGLYCKFVVGVIHEMCLLLNIYCFRLGKRVVDSKLE